METNNNVSPTKKDSILKSLAIAGLLAILLVLAWLAIQLVNLFPGAFNSVASLAESINQNQETIIDTNQELGSLTITSNTALLNSSETMAIEWSKVSAHGSYVFSYECIEGVAITHLSEVGARPYDCNTNYNIGDTTTLTISIDSEKNRYADVPYTIAFLQTNDIKPRATGSNVVTIVNAAISNQFADNPATPTEDEVSPESAKEVTSTPETTPNPTPNTPTYTQEFTYAIPVSDPNGYPDLGASYVAVGSVVNQTFIAGPVSVKKAGAIQFTVKNFGTKTSRDWTFSMVLPSGTTYTSPTQTALKPNERAVLTIGFPAGAPALHTFELTLKESSDRNRQNDSFTQTVGFVQ